MSASVLLQLTSEILKMKFCIALLIFGVIAFEVVAESPQGAVSYPYCINCVNWIPKVGSYNALVNAPIGNCYCVVGSVKTCVGPSKNGPCCCQLSQIH
jgi:uncharacterized sodium:solute symporter family permease YidK